MLQLDIVIVISHEKFMSSHLIADKQRNDILIT